MHQRLRRVIVIGLLALGIAASGLYSAQALGSNHRVVGEILPNPLSTVAVDFGSNGIADGTVNG
jgi:hypothetical protein